MATKEVKWSGPTGKSAIAGVCVLAVGFGVGFGVGWGAWGADNSSSGSSCSSSITVTPDASHGTGIDIIRPYEPLSASVIRGGNPPGGGSPEVMLRRKMAMEAVMVPAFQVITHAVGALSGANITVEPRVMQSYVMRAYADNQDLLSRLYYAAQRLQVSPKFLASVSDIASALIDIFNYIRKGAASGFATAAAAAATSGHHHHHRSLQQATTTTSTTTSSSTGSRSSSNQPLPEQLLAAFVRAGLQAPELQGALGGLSAVYGNDLDELVQLVVDLYVAIRDLATKMPGLSAAMKAFHPEPPVRNNTRTPQTVGGLRNTSLKVTVTVRSPKVEFVVEDGTAAAAGRRLLQSATDPPLPAGFTPKGPADRPSLLIPVAFHVMLYDNGDGTWGPPDYQNAASMADRMVQVANYRLAPAKIQLFVREVRNDPAAWPYLRHSSHEAYNDCVADGNFYYVLCGEGVLINSNAVDFPRTLNVYVVGDNPTLWHRNDPSLT
ncbi:hypothetical protein HYH02_007033 [Chlamydomonas schloesseri]|uniref:Uncharacterized protein n=1 Tax=Chlamydomonas schloesseri TaxID=2026947 RepID=A0A835WJG3_9CHLO|nr:hypothetical protein HYH02_007033 [Chlamydomonas schloesseri]|eukprot:KAG2448005.1 hypothetical protein HYH02_007033 [Chlamydomonas schloesseri]